MALFNRIFQSQKRKPVNSSATSSFSTTIGNSGSARPFPFNAEQVRVLLYRENDKRVLFDSSAIQKVNLAVSPSVAPATSATANARRKSDAYRTGSPHFIESNGFAYKYAHPKATTAADCNTLAEMVFGASPMSFRGTTLKVHWLQSPSRILCSQVFAPPSQPNSFANTSSGFAPQPCSFSDTSSADGISLGSSTFSTNPLDVPMSDYCSSGSFRPFACSAGDSGYSGTDPWAYSSFSGQSSFGSVDDEMQTDRKMSSDSTIPENTDFGSMQRRVMRNKSTSFENRRSVSDLIGFFSDNYRGPPNGAVGGSDGCVTAQMRRHSVAVESRSNPEMNRRRGMSGGDVGLCIVKARDKLGLAICITLTDSVEKEMQVFCSEHILLIESMLNRLRAMAENAVINNKRFFYIMVHSWLSTTRWIADLFTAPRLVDPIWLTLSASMDDDGTNSLVIDKLAHNFMKEFAWLLTCADTKDTNFFISTLLTAILTHHLGWVATVAPLSSHHKISLADPANPIILIQKDRDRMAEVSRAFPYNALWAQLGDLYGAMGSPPRISKTIITGSDQPVIDRVLRMLTYFIRCGEVKRHIQKEIVDRKSIKEVFDMSNKRRHRSGMTRSSTCRRDLQEICDNNNTMRKRYAEASNLSIETSKRNDIPNVLVFRDSRFVKQELRIGNFLMDTGIEMNPKQRLAIQNYQYKKSPQLLVTGPDNREIKVELADEVTETNVMELKRSKSLYTKSTNAKSSDHKRRVNRLTRKASAPKNLHSIGDYEGIEDESNLKAFASLSDLITANSVGASERLTWGIERVKEAVSLEEEQHFEVAKKRAEGRVVFILGDNDPLVGYKSRSTVYIHPPKKDSSGEEDDQGAKRTEEHSKKIFKLYETQADKERIEKQLFPIHASYEHYDHNHNPTSDTDSDDGSSNDIRTERSYSPISVRSSDAEFRSRTSDPPPKISYDLPDNNLVNLVTLPLPKTESEQSTPSPGFIPSLFTGASDHYIADMVLQGIVMPPKTGSANPEADVPPPVWEGTLRQDLALASHCATLEQNRTENVAVVGDIDKWDVKLISSQSFSIPSGNGISGPVGMSELVSSMLETVQAMHAAGSSSFQCIEFIESKLQEMYLHSETLAAFLLATNFCTLSSVTTALNLSENDVPLLLSIASVHSPQVSRKYGVSFR